jgi:hypothetical protein
MESDVAELARRAREMQGTAMVRQPLALLPALAGVLPGGVVTGAVYAVQDSASIALSLLAGPSAQGEWGAVIGFPDLGAEAATALGVDLSRTIVVPDPGTDWLMVAATLIEVLPLVILRPPAGVRDAEASRLASRVRHRRSTLVVLLDRGQKWPRAEAHLEITDSAWGGLGTAGTGYLRTRSLTVSARGKWGRPHVSSLWFVDGIPDLGPVAGPGLPTRVPASAPDSQAS